MGYSKWKKLLTILMIVNLCFVLFAKFTRSFGASVNSFQVEGGTITFPSWTLGSGYNCYLFQQPTLTSDVYRWVALVTRDNGQLKKSSQNNSFYTGSTWISSSNTGITMASSNSSYYTPFTGTVSEFQSRINGLANKSYQSAIWWNNSTMNSVNLDYENSYIYSTSDILDSEGNVLYPEGTYTPDSLIKYPQVATSISDLETLNFDVISVDGRDYSTKDFDILFYDKNVVNNSDSIYPKRIITLNQNTTYFQPNLSANPNINAIYWIPIDEIGLNLYIGGSYEIRFAERVPYQGGGGFREGDEYTYNYLGQPVNFTISSNVTQDKIDALNKEIEDTTEKKYHDQTINTINNINNFLNDSNINDSTNDDINNSLNFNNQNSSLNNLNGGFFSRLTTMLSNLLGYDLSQDTSVSIPMPNSNKYITLHSIDIYNNVTGALRLIINAFWFYIFAFYMWKFINKIYIAVSTGNILDTFSSSGEAITNDML